MGFPYKLTEQLCISKVTWVGTIYFVLPADVIQNMEVPLCKMLIRTGVFYETSQKTIGTSKRFFGENYHISKPTFVSSMLKANYIFLNRL